MRSSVPLVIGLAVFCGCAAVRPAAGCKPPSGGEAVSSWGDASDVPLDPLRTFGPSEVIQVHQPESKPPCR